MKLIIQIPCFNEAATLGRTIDDLPTALEGIDEIEILVIDDGSTDDTSGIAQSHGVKHIVRLPQNQGLARAFGIGFNKALELGADIIVNTDGDHQYQGQYITNLIRPILDGEADLVVGDRQVDQVIHFSAPKRFLQKLGSKVVSWTAGTKVTDATSGFRAFSREAALRLFVFSNYTYTLETIIQAGRKGLIVVSVPVETNERLRESRLIRSIPRYVFRSSITIIRIFLMYEPLQVFLSLGMIPSFFGILLIARFLYYFVNGQGQGHIQSLIIASILVVLGFLTILLGLLADLIARNRWLNEEISYNLRRLELERQSQKFST